MASIWPVYMGERWTFSRMRRSVSGVVCAMWQHDLAQRRIFFVVRKLKGVGSASPGCSSKLDQSMVRPSSRGGVPVLRRHSRRPSRFRAFAEQDAGGFAAAAGGVLLLAAVDEAVEECAGGDDDGCGVDGAAVAELEAANASCSMAASI